MEDKKHQLKFVKSMLSSIEESKELCNHIVCSGLLCCDCPLLPDKTRTIYSLNINNYYHRCKYHYDIDLTLSKLREMFPEEVFEWQIKNT